MIDNFSSQSSEYSKYRPTYPDELIQYILSFINSKENAWDCGTGNGQLAEKISPYFINVFGTDISASQLSNAIKASNIFYSLQPAEKTTFPNDNFNLITVAQAIHWFQFENFYAEVRRTLRKDGIIAVLGYGLISVSPEVDKVIGRLYTKILGSYWDKERRYIDEGYNTIPFPFEEIKTPQFKINYHWSLNHLLGYLNTWSAVQHFIRINGQNPVELIKDDLQIAWKGADPIEITFPILLRLGKLQ